ncbi:MAG: hypothetical protein K0Q50_1321 [Vampirovibrio sp.]|jgi:hypothetical protein|nr:hypothetical protein [Vampirovibrio sp.]
MTNTLTTPFSITSAFGTLFSQVVLLLLGTPPTVDVVRVVVGVEGRMTAKGGHIHGCA